MESDSRTLVAQIDEAVEAYRQKLTNFETDAVVLQQRLTADQPLMALVHSIRWRAKDPEHLRGKLHRYAARAQAEGRVLEIGASNVFDLVSDLAGVRILHLHMRQIEALHPRLLHIFAEEGYVLVGKPEAKTWDIEYEQMFKKLGLEVTRSDSMYTSVHYVLKQNSRTARQCELQVRTLAEEIWGEISHAVNYPDETDSVACKEQLKVLARIVSGCSRLVGSIVASYEDHRQRNHNGCIDIEEGRLRPRNDANVLTEEEDEHTAERPLVRD